MVRRAWPQAPEIPALLGVGGTTSLHDIACPPAQGHIIPHADIRGHWVVSWAELWASHSHLWWGDTSSQLDAAVEGVAMASGVGADPARPLGVRVTFSTLAPGRWALGRPVQSVPTKYSDSRVHQDVRTGPLASAGR